MRIVQILLPGASEYERKSQRIDHAAFSASHDVTLVALGDVHAANADVAHLYASSKLPASELVGFPIPYIATAEIARSRWSFRKPVEPEFVVSPLGEQAVPEAVEERYFEWAVGGGRWAEGPRKIGTFGAHRGSVASLIERTLARIQRVRDDVEWKVFDRVPSPENLHGVDLWVDPVSDDADFDGFVAEAIVCGLPVVAGRTPINIQRLEKGRSGFLVPCNDANELAHAILTALFKSEVAQQKKEAALQTVSKFRHRQRFRILSHLYETVIS